jgi:hypothetical protein
MVPRPVLPGSCIVRRPSDIPPSDVKAEEGAAATGDDDKDDNATPAVLPLVALCTVRATTPSALRAAPPYLSVRRTSSPARDSTRRRVPLIRLLLPCLRSLAQLLPLLLLPAEALSGTVSLSVFAGAPRAPASAPCSPVPSAALVAPPASTFAARSATAP